ncbi:MAG: FAD-dependent oxidoreductase [Alphaproteobacteria bacterium]|nr:FAD-dependent oxidoreductase [Alphaproteobacteria bacterium]
MALPARAPALIVGGGPAGAAAAIALARAGRPPRLLERTSGAHDTVCGAFVGWDAIAALRRLGIDPFALGAHPIHRLRLFGSGREVETRLPRTAAGLSRRCLDETLLAAARQAGAFVDRGRSVRAADVGARTIRTDDGEEIGADALLLATGKHELRGAVRPRDTSRDPIGLRTALSPSKQLDAVLDGVIELHLFDGGYAGLLLQEDGCANLCLSVQRWRLKGAGGIPNLVRALADALPAFRARLAHGDPVGWSAVSGVPYGWYARETAPGLYRLGDQGAVIASLAGDGIAIALESAAEAAAAILAGDGAEAYQGRLGRRTALPLTVAEGLRWAAERPVPRDLLMGLVAAVPALPRFAARLTRVGT